VRKPGLVVLALLLVALAAACGSTKKSATGTGTSTGKTSCTKSDLNLVSPGELTIGTDNPAFPPWFGGTPKSPWKVSDPRSGEGYESAVAYAVAKKLGFSHDEVTWKVVPFNTSFAPGTKSFDFDINQISFTPARAKVVDFSDSYYDVNQAIAVLKGTPIANAKSIADLKPYKLGAQLGTTSYDFIKRKIDPSKQPAVYDTNDAAVQAFKNKQIDGLVVDLPTAIFITAAEVDNSEVLGQFASPAGEHFAMVFAKGNSLVKCVNQALASLKSDGTLKKIQDKWLSQVVGVPVLK
jgi:polar amino acid transport system substrate-binding protein